MVIKRLRGRETVRFEVRDSKTRNEPLDCRVYAMGAYEILNPDLKKVSGKKDAPPVRKVKRPRRLTMRRGMMI